MMPPARDIILQYRDGGLQHILELHRGYDPLQYPLLFPNGTDGWHVNLKLQNGRKLMAMVYYRYHIIMYLYYCVPNGFSNSTWLMPTAKLKLNDWSF